MSLRGSFARRVGALHPELETRLSWMSYRRRNASLRLVDALVRKGDVVVDVGAADGLYADRLSQLVGRHGSVFAFEPNPAQFALLQVVSDRRKNVTAFPLGLSDHSGQAELHVPVLGNDQRPGLGSISVPAKRMDVEHRTVSVGLERLDAVLSWQTRRVAFVKCDVEGHEGAVLRGAQGMLQHWLPPILIEIEQRHQDAPISATFELLEGFGYHGFALEGNGLRPLEEFSVERDQLAFVGDDFEEILPDAYVNDFLFVPQRDQLVGIVVAANRRRF